MIKTMCFVLIGLITMSCLIQAQNKIKTDNSVDSSVIVLPKFTLDEKRRSDIIEYKNYDLNADSNKIYTVIEQMPQFPGGEYGLMIYLQKNTKYPESKTDIHGKVIVHFEVTKTGEIGRTEILKSINPTFDNEALRVVKRMPKWIPGKHNGKYINVWYTLPIKFMKSQPEIKPTIAGVTLELYESVKQMPQFPGGGNELLNYISKNMMYPLSAKQKGIQGNVYVRFIVTNTGKLDHIEVVRPLTPDCDAEAVRLVKDSPEWIPGKLDGKNVNVYYTISVPFKLK